MSTKTNEPPTAVIQTRLNDIGDLGRMVGWEFDFRQLDPGPVDIPVRARVGRHVALLKVGFNRSYHQRGLAPADVLTFGTPLTGSLDWYERSIDSPAIMNFNHSSGFDCVSKDGFSAVVFSIKEEFLHGVSETLHLPAPDNLLTPQVGSVVQHPASVSTLWRLLNQLIDAERPELKQEQESMLVAELLKATLADVDSDGKVGLRARSRAISRALDYIEDNGRDSVKVSQICKDTGVSLRTLDRAFLERFGIGPKAYLMRRRLMGVREILSTCYGKVRVVDAANDWGFWHMGQFSHDYQKLFGELPSDTLNERGPKSTGRHLPNLNWLQTKG